MSYNSDAITTARFVRFEASFYCDQGDVDLDFLGEVMDYQIKKEAIKNGMYITVSGLSGDQAKLLIGKVEPKVSTSVGSCRSLP